MDHSLWSAFEANLTFCEIALDSTEPLEAKHCTAQTDVQRPSVFDWKTFLFLVLYRVNKQQALIYCSSIQLFIYTLHLFHKEFEAITGLQV